MIITQEPELLLTRRFFESSLMLLPIMKIFSAMQFEWSLEKHYHNSNLKNLFLKVFLITKNIENYLKNISKGRFLLKNYGEKSLQEIKSLMGIVSGDTVCHPA